MRIGIFILLLMTCSCLPIPFTTDVKPQICGIVVDAKTKKPMERVDIIYECGEYRKEYRLEGKKDFKVGPLKQWHFLIYLGSPGVAPFPDSLNYWDTPALLTFSAEGYKTQSLQNWTWSYIVKESNNEFKIDPSFKGIEVMCSTQNMVNVYMNKKDNKSAHGPR